MDLNGAKKRPGGGINSISFILHRCSPPPPFLFCPAGYVCVVSVRPFFSSHKKSFSASSSFGLVKLSPLSREEFGQLVGVPLN